MFNTYQELADRIEELLKERESLKRKIKHLEELYSKISVREVNSLYERQEITREERLYWSILQMKKKGERENENKQQPN